MADDDPWANHVRGLSTPTPVNDQSDPLSLNTTPTTQANGYIDSPALLGKDATQGSQSTRNVPDKGPASQLEAAWGTEGQQREDTKERPQNQSQEDSVQSSHSLFDTSATSAPIPDHGADGRGELVEEGLEENEEDGFVYPGESSNIESHDNIDNDYGGEAQEEQQDDGEFVYTGGGETTEATNESHQHESMEAVSDARGTSMVSSEIPKDSGSVRDGPDLVPSPPSASQAEPKPVDYGRLSQLCSQGPLSSLQSFFTVTNAPPPAGAGISAFALANEPNPASGLAPIHYAAREGKTDILKWLIQEAGALIEMEDREGETALHKAALAGKLPALTCLLSAGASADCTDGDGWTPLHNASSRGYLDIAKVLTENAGASIDIKGGRGGWTPLMNAASNGHLPVVRYLTSKLHADPFARNLAGETAYDVAAATFEIYICQVLEKYEAERWAALRFAASAPRNESRQQQTMPGQGPYNPLALHIFVPVILHENQRLDTRLSTLAIHGGKPRWSGTGAGQPNKPDRRAPGTMPPGPLSLSRTRNVPMKRDDVRVPTRDQPYKLGLATRSEQMAAARRVRGENVEGTQQSPSNEHEELASTPTPDSVLRGRGTPLTKEQSHFWLSDWQVDLTDPQVDADEGWQYVQTFHAPEESWNASVPPPLARLLEGRGLGASVSRAMTGGILPGPGQGQSQGSNNDQEAVTTGWVRRRRWVRVMRRRLDIEFGDELEAAERALNNLAASSDDEDDGAGQRSAGVLVPAAIVNAQQAAREECEALGPSADYIAKAKALAGATSASMTPADVMGDNGQDLDEIKKRIARLDLAIIELRSHAFSDEDADRQAQAEDLLKEYTVQLGQFKQAAGLEEGSDEEDEDDDEEFIYPNSYKDDGQSVITRIGPASTPLVPPCQSSDVTVFGISTAPSEVGTSVGATRSADLANAREFRVPTREVPNRPNLGQRNTSLREQNLLPQWEHDTDAVECRGCNRKFTFFVRKHHCRRCGRIFCDACSSKRAHLSASELIIDPGVPEMLLAETQGPSRICNSCDVERQLPSPLRSQRGADALSSGFMDNLRHGSMSDVSSRASELNECPVCGQTLATLGDSNVQEEHVRDCLENGGGGSVQEGRYLVYKLAEGPIVGKECQICLEDLCVGMTIARLPCLCYYHRHCIDSWFSRGRSCPVHARTW